MLTQMRPGIYGRVIQCVWFQHCAAFYPIASLRLGANGGESTNLMLHCWKRPRTVVCDWVRNGHSFNRIVVNNGVDNSVVVADA